MQWGIMQLLQYANQMLAINDEAILSVMIGKKRFEFTCEPDEDLKVFLDGAEQLFKLLRLTDVIVPKGTLCECGGKERVALDCTMKPCKHPLSFMKNYKTNTNTNR